MTIASKLLQMNGVKEDIRDAIESFGYDLSEATFFDYADYICDIGEQTEITKTANPSLVGSIQNDLIQLSRIKTDIKNAIESKGLDLTSIPFTEYYEYIMLIPVNPQVTITASVWDNRGTATGGGTYSVGDEVELEATFDDNDYTLNRWCVPYDPNYPLGYPIREEYDNPLTIEAERDEDWVAILTRNDEVRHVEIFSNDTTLGTISGDETGDYNAGDTISVTAVPKTGAHFVCWVSQDGFSYEDGLELEVIDDGYIEAIFASDSANCSVTLLYSPYYDSEGSSAECGTVTGTGTYSVGDTATLTAVPEEGYVFSNMFVYPPNPYMELFEYMYPIDEQELEIEVNSDLIVTPYFTNEVSVSFNEYYSDDTHGSWELSDSEDPYGATYPAGETVTITCYPDSGYAPYFTLNDEPIEFVNNEYSFVPDKPYNELTARFYYTTPLTFTSKEDNSTIGWTGTYPDIEYSTDGGETWTSFTEPITVDEDDSVMFQGNNWSASSASSHFTTSGSFDLSGGIMSLCDITKTRIEIPLNCFNSLFSGCDIVDADNLILADNTTTSCYELMFYNCASLVGAPDLPAEVAATRCYMSMFKWCSSLMDSIEIAATEVNTYSCADMFNGCTSMNVAPELPATTLGYMCYWNMFYGCTGLEMPISQLPAMTLASGCYNQMFYGCSSLVTPPELPATTLVEFCYMNMFAECTSLIESPELPATTLAQNCYYNMFRGCSSLSYIKCLATDISASSCTTDWVKNVAATGKFEKNASMSGWTVGDNGIPTGWVVVDEGQIYVTALSNDTTKGTVSGGGAYDIGDTVTLTATAASGNEFVNWTVDGTQVSASNPYTFTASDSISIVANFQAEPRVLKVTAVDNGLEFNLNNGNYVGEWSKDNGSTWTYSSNCTLNADETALCRYHSGSYSEGVTPSKPQIVSSGKRYKLSGYLDGLMFPSNYSGNRYLGAANSLWKQDTALYSIKGLKLNVYNVNYAFNQTFYGCSGLVYGDCEFMNSYNEPHAFYQTMANCSSLTTVPSRIKIGNLTGNKWNYLMFQTFAFCHQLVDVSNTVIDFDSISLSAVNSGQSLDSPFSGVFGNCSRLVHGPVIGKETSTITLPTLSKSTKIRAIFSNVCPANNSVLTDFTFAPAISSWSVSMYNQSSRKWYDFYPYDFGAKSSSGTMYKHYNTPTPSSNTNIGVESGWTIQDYNQAP